MRIARTHLFLPTAAAIALLGLVGGSIGLQAEEARQVEQQKHDASKEAAIERAEARDALKRELAADVHQLQAFSRAFRMVAKLVSPSVVHIRVTKEMPASTLQFNPFNDDLLRRFFGDSPFDGDGGSSPGGRQHMVQVAEGSGVVYSADGLIITNNHVVSGADKIEVKFTDGRELPAKVVGTDPKTDLAVVRVDATDLLPIDLGKSADLEVGDWVIAVGNPFGLSHTVTAGIVSAVGRANVGITDYEDFIQTDAAINPGNSGGPLVDLMGRLIGINTAIVSRTGGFQGIGFAIPVDMVREVAGQLVKTGHVRRGWLGISIQPLSPDLARRFGLDGTKGVLVGGVLPKGPSAEAGVEPGDVITTLDGESVASPNELRNRIAADVPGAQVTLGVVRQGKPIEIKVKLGELEETAMAGAAPGRRGGSQGEHEEGSPTGRKLGLTVRPLTPGLSRQLRVPSGEQGVVVDSVDSGSPAAMGGLQPGDVIEEVDRAPTPDLKSFDAAMKKADLAEGVLFRVRRREMTSYMLLKVG